MAQDRDNRGRWFNVRPPQNNQQIRWNAGYAIIAIFGVFLLQGLIMDLQRTDQIPFSEFEKQLDAGNIERVTVGSETLDGIYSEPVDGKTEFVTRRVQGDIVDQLEEAGVEYDGKVETDFWTGILSWIIPLGIFFALWYFVIRRMMQQGGPGGQLMQIGKSNARVSYEQDTGTSFEDVAGIDEAREELEELVAFLKNPQDYGRLGAKVPKGVLLAGPPGTGKTLVARAMAGEAAVPFFYINGSEFVQMFVGVGAARVRDLFKQANEHAPAIIFIDELDALGAARNSQPGMAGGGNDEKEQTLHQLLVELDGFDPTSGLLVLGATNRAEILDPALLRAGRFDRHISVPRPDKKGRIDILRVHARKVKLADGVDFEAIARLTAGFSGADLENLVNEAALLATRREADAVEQVDFTAAIERLVAGSEKKNRPMSEEERVRVAYHELGHAYLGLSLPGADPVQKVSIVPRSIGALGYTLQRPIGDRFLMTRSELIDKITVLLGGRAAEAVFFEDISTGATDDLQKVTQMARAVVAKYGMTETLGLMAYDNDQHTQGGLPQALQKRDHGDETARLIDETSRKIVDDAYARAKDMIEKARSRIDTVAQHLLEVETLSESELRSQLAPERST
ncbi:MAG: ATP-dependent zinc metalloprotease FtsH [Pseudomonadota bacterium]